MDIRRCLNLDCIIHKLQNLEIADVLNVVQTDSYMADIVEEHFAKSLSKDILMAGHNSSMVAKYRTPMELTYTDRLKVGQNWINGNYSQHRFNVSDRWSWCSKLHLERDFIYSVANNKLIKYNRSKYEYKIFEGPGEEIPIDCNCPIPHFFKEDETLFIICDFGHLYFIENGVTKTENLLLSNDFIEDADYSKNILVTKLCFSTNIWQRSEFSFTSKHEIPQCYHKVHLNMQGTKFYGTLGHHNITRRFHEVDLETAVVTVLNPVLPEVHNVKLMNENTFLFTCKNKSLQIYDRRVDNIVSNWTYISDLNCIEYDGLNGALVSAHNGTIILFDIRKTRNRVKEYSSNSPDMIRDIAADNCSLFYVSSDDIGKFNFKN